VEPAHSVSQENAMLGKSSDGASPDFQDRRQDLYDWWGSLSQSGDAGCSSWEVLDGVQAQVTDALSLGPPGIGLAEHLTARALLMVSGQIDI
jgi:hypothetical protein